MAKINKGKYKIPKSKPTCSHETAKIQLSTTKCVPKGYISNPKKDRVEHNIRSIERHIHQQRKWLEFFKDALLVGLFLTVCFVLCWKIGIPNGLLINNQPKLTENIFEALTIVGFVVCCGSLTTGGILLCSYTSNREELEQLHHMLWCLREEENS